MPNFILVLSHWTDDVIDGSYCMIMTQHFILCDSYYCSYTDFCDMYWLVVSWSGGHNYMDLVVSCTMYWCPYLYLEVLDLYSLVLPSLGRIEVVIPAICFGLLVLAPSFIVFTHPLPSSLVFNSIDFLTYGMEDLFSPLELLLDKPPFYIVPWLWVGDKTCLW